MRAAIDVGDTDKLPPTHKKMYLDDKLNSRVASALTSGAMRLLL